MNNGSTTRYYGKYRGTVLNNVDPGATRSHSGDGAGRSGFTSNHLGNAVRADGGNRAGNVHDSADQSRRLD